MSTAVATTQRTSLRLFEDYTDETKYVILRPTKTVMAATSPFYAVYAQEIAWEIEKDTYEVDGGKRSFNKRGYDRIASAAGIDFLQVMRVDDGRDPDIATVSVLGRMKRADGSLIFTTGIKTRDAKLLPGKGSVASKRLFVLEKAETGAKGRVVKSFMALEGAYYPSDLKKIFVVPQITVNQAEISKDPELRRMQGMMALGATSLLYPSQTPPFSPQLPPPEEPHVAALPSGSSSPEAEHAALPAAETVLATELPDFDDEPKDTPLQAEIREMWETREHSLKPTAFDEMMDADPVKQQKYIDWMGDFPKKATTAPTNGQGAVGWEPSEAQTRRLYALAKKAGYNSDAVHELIARLFGGIASTKDLTREQYDFLCGDEKKEIASWLEANPKGGAA